MSGSSTCTETGRPFTVIATVCAMAPSQEDQSVLIFMTAMLRLCRRTVNSASAALDPGPRLRPARMRSRGQARSSSGLRAQGAPRLVRHRPNHHAAEDALELGAYGAAGIKIPAVDDREPETAGRHRVQFGRLVRLEGDLDRGDMRPLQQVGDAGCRRLPLDAVCAEQHDAVASAAVAIVELPFAAAVEVDDR